MVRLVVTVSDSAMAVKNAWKLDKLIRPRLREVVQVSGRTRDDSLYSFSRRACQADRVLPRSAEVPQGGSGRDTCDD